MSYCSLRYTREEFGSKIAHLLTSLQIRPNNLELYILAGIHRSVLNEWSVGYIESNERLEYLGDAVLELTITERLYHDFPEKLEWELTDIRSALVRGRNLAMIARWLGLSDIIQLSRWESNANGYENPYILANTLEAVIGAIYLDQWFEVVKDVILRYVYPTLPRILSEWLYVDPKSHLQEVTQAIWGVTPTYVVHTEEWADHNKIYHMSVFLDTLELGRGKWTSKKKWEQNAAENAISQRKKWESQVSLSRVSKEW